MVLLNFLGVNAITDLNVKCSFLSLNFPRAVMFGLW